jgi:hypothetical protein
MFHRIESSHSMFKKKVWQKDAKEKERLLF